MQFESIKFLMELIIFYFFYYTPLAFASENGHTKIVQLLLEKEEIDPCIETIYHFMNLMIF